MSVTKANLLFILLTKPWRLLLVLLRLKNCHGGGAALLPRCADTMVAVARFMNLSLKPTASGALFCTAISCHVSPLETVLLSVPCRFHWDLIDASLERNDPTVHVDALLFRSVGRCDVCAGASTVSLGHTVTSAREVQGRSHACASTRCHRARSTIASQPANKQGRMH